MAANVMCQYREIWPAASTQRKYGVCHQEARRRGGFARTMHRACVASSVARRVAYQRTHRRRSFAR